MFAANGLTVLLASALLAPPLARADTAAVEVERMRLAAATLDLAVARETRVQRITDRIRISAGDLCKGDRAPIFGILAASEEEVPCSLRGVVVERFGQGDWVGQQDCDSESGLGKNVFVLDVRTDTPGPSGRPSGLATTSSRWTARSSNAVTCCTESVRRVWGRRWSSSWGAVKS